MTKVAFLTIPRRVFYTYKKKITFKRYGKQNGSNAPKTKGNERGET